jgi:HAMP domain-containing protein
MSLTKRITGLVALALVPALAIQGYNEYALRDARGEVLRGEALQAARAIASDLGQFGRSARQTLVILAGVPEIRNKDPGACTAYLRSLLGQVPGAFFFGVTDADGRIVCNTLGSKPGAYTVADRRYFQEAMRTGSFAVGDYVAGRVTNQPTIQFGQPIRGSDDRPNGIVLTSIDLSWLAGNLSAGGLPPDATLTVTDRNGAILVRLPDHEAWVGKPLPTAFRKRISENLGGVIDMPGLRGRMRLTGIAAPNGNDLDAMRVAVGLARDASFADIDAATRRGIVLILTGALLAFAAALLGGRVFIRRPVRRLLQAVTAWRSGDLDARSGVTGSGEFGQLGEAFDAMAASLQKHESDLRQELARRVLGLHR